MLTTKLDNSSSAYKCNDTEDKVFILSLNEVTDLSIYGFSSNNSRLAKATDYAKAIIYEPYKEEPDDSIEYYSYWLRTPYEDAYDKAVYVNRLGETIDMGRSVLTKSCEYGIRSAITISFD